MSTNDPNALRTAFRRMILVSLLAPAAIIDACASHEANDSSTDAGLDGPRDDSSTSAAVADADPSDADAARDPCAPIPYIGTDDAGTCTELAYYPCGLPVGIVSRGNCYFSPTDCRTLCPGFSFNCHTWDDSCFDGSIPESGPVTVDCVKCPNAAGRRPPGLKPARAIAHSSPIGAYFARAAYLEAASVHAFHRLHQDLSCYGAPQDLLARALSAKEDEVRHAEFTARMARHYGDEALVPRVAPSCHRDLESIATENMVEGCIRETFGALTACWQATHSEEHEVSSGLAQLAEDETAHAELSWDVARWLQTRLSPSARARLRMKAHEALRALQHELSVLDSEQNEEALQRVAGLPARSTRDSLFVQFERFAHERLSNEACFA